VMRWWPESWPIHPDWIQMSPMSPLGVGGGSGGRGHGEAVDRDIIDLMLGEVEVRCGVDLAGGSGGSDGKALLALELVHELLEVVIDVAPDARLFGHMLGHGW
jgi:hypothetical protein